MQRRKFSREFKLEAVKLVRERGVSVSQAVRDLLHLQLSHLRRAARLARPSGRRPFMWSASHRTADACP